MNLPLCFVDYTRALLGEAEYAALFEALQDDFPVSIRINRLKWRDVSAIYNRVYWSADGYYLDERPAFTFDPLFHAGCYYVQEASSMFIEQVVRQYVTGPVKVLDLCAAPGGKSTHLRSLLPEGSLLVANEVIRSRVQVLAENLVKWGHPDIVVTHTDPSDFRMSGLIFDVILTDVPCSGEGMFRKDPTAIDEWSEGNVDICQSRQRRIVEDIWPCLKPGGILIYSTCTYNTKEDEENVLWLQRELGAEPLALEVPDAWGITGNLLTEGDLPVYRFFPHKTRGEGFFLAVLRKPADEEEEEPIRSQRMKPAGRKHGKEAKKASAMGKESLSVADGWIDEAAKETHLLAMEESRIRLYPRAYVEEIARMRQALRVLCAGVEVGEVKGKDVLPCHGLAMAWPVMNKGAFATEEVDYKQAVAYLRKEAVGLSATTPRGYVLLTYRQIPLGFVKNIGSRANNLYPQEWRIRSGYLPDGVNVL